MPKIVECDICGYRTTNLKMHKLFTHGIEPEGFNEVFPPIED